MAHWKALQLSDVVLGIDQGEYVLPVIQRRLVWNEEKMELLFDSLLKKNSFGGIMVLEENRGSEPLFAFRSFSKHGEETQAKEEKSLSQTCNLVIDGQQRLQAFYMGLLGSFNQKVLYFDLLSVDDEYDFRFKSDSDILPMTITRDDGDKRTTCWYSVPTLFKQLRLVGDPYQVTGEIAEQVGVKDTGDIHRMQRNIFQFQLNVVTMSAVGIATVTVNKTDVDREKMRVVELFRRLNDGGTRLSSFDLVASMFKGFNYKMEGFFRAVGDFDDIYFDQDEMIKLIFLLQDEPAREAIHVKAKDAEYAIENQARILEVLRTLRAFLKTSGLYGYFNNANRSAIPLYFIAYHLFHKELPTSKLATVYANFDINNPDYVRLKRWLYLSLLNGVFSRGRGWIPYRTGIRKILDVLKMHKNGIFPVAEILAVYTGYPLIFTAVIDAKALDSLDRDFLFDLIYDHDVPSGRDIDHIHPRSILETRLTQLGDAAPFTWNDVNSIGNYQLLDPNTNRGVKRAKPLGEWISSDAIGDNLGYCKRHLIPSNPDLWQIENFHTFLEQRKQAIVEKVIQAIPGPWPVPPVVKPQPIDVPELAGEGIGEANVPAFTDSTTINAYFNRVGGGPAWASRYSNGLGALGIATMGDLARTIQERGLAYVGPQKYGKAYRFVRPDADGEDTQPKTKAFGGWGWVTALNGLESNGFDWRQYLVTAE